MAVGLQESCGNSIKRTLTTSLIQGFQACQRIGVQQVLKLSEGLSEMQQRVEGVEALRGCIAVCRPTRGFWIECCSIESLSLSDYKLAHGQASLPQLVDQVTTLSERCADRGAAASA